VNLVTARRTDCSDTPICRAISASVNLLVDVNSSVREIATQASRGSVARDMNTSTDLRIFMHSSAASRYSVMVIGKRFDLIDRVCVITGQIPIRWIEKFGLVVEVFHAEVSKGAGFPFITCGHYRRITKPERPGPKRENGNSRILRGIWRWRQARFDEGVRSGMT
jgi:hypothetical protein